MDRKTMPSPTMAKGSNARLIARQSSPVQRPVVLMVAFGLKGEVLEHAIAQAKPSTPDEPEPVFLIDHTDFSALTKNDALFEHFPSSTSMDMLEGDLPWSRYAERRFDFLVAKWWPVSIIPLGKRSLNVLSSWRERRESEVLRRTAFSTD